MSRYSRRAAKRAQIGLDLPMPEVPGMYDTGIVGVEEAVIQSAVLDFLRVHTLVGWVERFNSAAGHLVYEDGTQSQFMRFAFKGCSDILGQLKDGRLLAVECKRWDGKLKYEQAVFLDRVIRNKGVGFVAKSPESVQLYLR